MIQDQRTILIGSRMSPAQVMVVLVIIGLNAVGGFDVLSISFAAPDCVHGGNEP